MAWVRLEPDITENRKIVQAGPLAAYLHIAGICYCNRQQTDGRIPERVLPQLVNWNGVARQITDGQLTSTWDDISPHELANILVDADLWHEVDGGFEIHDYLQYQPSKAKLEQEVEQRRSAGRAGGKAKRKRESSEPFRGGTIGGVPVSVPVPEKNHNDKSPSAVVAREFEDWLSHYHSVTGRSDVRGSTAARAAFMARRNEGFSLDELKLATAGCHGDDFCREHKHDVPETILRASKVQRYIQLGKEPKGKQRGRLVA